MFTGPVMLILVSTKLGHMAMARFSSSPYHSHIDIGHSHIETVWPRAELRMYYSCIYHAILEGIVNTKFSDWLGRFRNAKLKSKTLPPFSII